MFLHVTRLRLGTLLPPFCSGGSVPATGVIAPLRVYGCVRAEGYTSRGLFTNPPSYSYDMVTQWLKGKKTTFFLAI